MSSPSAHARRMNQPVGRAPAQVAATRKNACLDRTGSASFAPYRPSAPNHVAIMTIRSLRLLPALSAVAILCLLPACGSGDGDGARELPSTPEGLADEMDRATDQVVDVIKSIRDSDTAKAAEVRLAELRKRMLALKQQMEQLRDQFTEEQIRELEARTRADAAEMTRELTAEIMRIARDPELREMLNEINRMLVEELSPYQ